MVLFSIYVIFELFRYYILVSEKKKKGDLNWPVKLIPKYVTTHLSTKCTPGIPVVTLKLVIIVD